MVNKEADVNEFCDYMDGGYRTFFIETVRFSGGGSANSIRARPLPGQGVSTEYFTECSTSERVSNPVGTIFRIQGKIIEREGSPFLYTSYRWPIQVVSREEAELHINQS